MAKYFNHEYNDLQELRRDFRDLCKKLHPDFGGDAEEFKTMNEEYKKAVQNFRPAEHNGKPDTYQKAFADTLDEEFQAVIIELLRLGLEIEICGVWLWIHGNTKAVKEQLKACGCCWAPTKKLWYWRPTWAKSYGSKKRQSMEIIRAKYGSAWVDTESKPERLQKGA